MYKILIGTFILICSRLFSQTIQFDLSEYIVKDIQYDYDLVSGKVNQVTYQRGESDQFIHKYSYDGDNRIQEVYTSTNGVDWVRDAKYEYYAHGPLANTVLGAISVDSSVYVYTLQGWIKGVQARNFSYALGYNSHDYGSIGTNGLLATPIANNSSGKSTSLYNGNVATWATNIPALATKGVSNMTNQYTYDQLNRIKSSKVSDMGLAYSTNYQYDPNGNILALQRYNQIGQKFDAFKYNYESKSMGYLSNTNKLRWVDDTITNQVLNDEDLEDQDVDNYKYDDIGNLFYNGQEDIDRIEWTVYGKIKAVYRKNGSLKPNLVFEYDAIGNRVTKISIAQDGTTTKTFYLRDASGNVLGTYANTGINSSISLQERYLFGSSRLGVLVQDQRYYEFVDHLGNVRSIVDEFKEIKAAYEYYAFGMSLAKVDNGYRYGFNGKEKDGEFSNNYDFGDRTYDTRITRWISVDKYRQRYPDYSPYVFALNSPIILKDADGNKVIFTTKFREFYLSVFRIFKKTDLATQLLNTWASKDGDFKISKSQIPGVLDDQVLEFTHKGDFITTIAGGGLTRLFILNSKNGWEEYSADVKIDKNTKFKVQIAVDLPVDDSDQEGSPEEKAHGAVILNHEAFLWANRFTEKLKQWKLGKLSNEDLKKEFDKYYSDYRERYKAINNPNSTLQQAHKALLNALEKELVAPKTPKEEGKNDIIFKQIEGAMAAMIEEVKAMGFGKGEDSKARTMKSTLEEDFNNRKKGYNKTYGTKYEIKKQD